MEILILMVHSLAVVSTGTTFQILLAFVSFQHLMLEFQSTDLVSPSIIAHLCMCIRT